jgi:hypothetical protein
MYVYRGMRGNAERKRERESAQTRRGWERRGETRRSEENGKAREISKISAKARIIKGSAMRKA